MAENLVQVVAGVIVQRGRVLICQRAAGGHHAGKWEFPGGKTEPAEELEQALRRELREELNIDAIVGPRLWRSECQYPGRAPFALTFFLVTHYAGTITNRIFAAVRWEEPLALGNFDFLEGDREFISNVENGVIMLPPAVEHQRP